MIFWWSHLKIQNIQLCTYLQEPTLLFAVGAENVIFTVKTHHLHQLSSPLPCVAYENHWPPLNIYINPCFSSPWSLLLRVALMRSNETTLMEHVSFRPSFCSSHFGNSVAFLTITSVGIWHVSMGHPGALTFMSISGAWKITLPPGLRKIFVYLMACIFSQSIPYISSKFGENLTVFV